MNHSFFEKILLNLVEDLVDFLPILAGKLLAFLFLIFIWPKLTRLILRSIDRATSLKNSDPLLISFLKSLIKTFMYIA